MSQVAPTSIPALLSALDASRAGLQRGVASFEQVAQAVAGGAPSAVSADAAVATLEARTQVSASARAFEAADRALGTLLDLRA